MTVDKVAAEQLMQLPPAGSGPPVPPQQYPPQQYPRAHG